MTRAPRPSRKQHARIAAILCSILLASSLPFAASAKGPKPGKKPDYKRQVEQLEELWRIAELNSDTGQMDKLLSDDYVGITMNGQVVTKAQQLQRMRSRQFVVTKIDLNDVKVKLIGTAAIVTCQAQVEGMNDGNPLHGTYRYTRVYTRLPSGAWKITNFEATRVGPKRGEHEAARGQGSAPASD